MITSSSNSQVKHVIQLNTKAKLRHEENLFVAEGMKLFQEAPAELLEKVFVSETFEREHRTMLEGIPCEVVEDGLFSRMCDTRTPQGILSLVRMPFWSWEQVVGGRNPLLLVLEDLQDPGNVGTILRTAEGAGVTGVIFSRKCADLFHPKTIRSTMGSVYRVPAYFAEDLSETVEKLRRERNTHLCGPPGGKALLRGGRLPGRQRVSHRKRGKRSQQETVGESGLSSSDSHGGEGGVFERGRGRRDSYVYGPRPEAFLILNTRRQPYYIEDEKIVLKYFNRLRGYFFIS